MTHITTEGLEAVKHYTGQLYEVTRGLHAAYQVDTGDQLDVLIVPWEDLTPGQRQAFMRAAWPAVDPLVHALYVGARLEE